MTRTCGDDCPRRHCAVDGRRHLEDDEAQTCVFCLGRARSNLDSIVELVALLPDELTERGGTSFDPIPRGARETAIPGGDALVLLAGGNQTGRHDPTFERSSDPQPPLVMLAAWEDDWRRLLGLAAAGAAAMSSVAGFLHRQLGWAAQNHPAFDEFAGDLHRCRRRLEATTRAGEPIDRGGRIPCPDCGEPLVRAFAEPRPCPHVPAAATETGSGAPIGVWVGYGVHPPVWRAQTRDEQDAGDEPETWRPCGCNQGGRADDWMCPNRRCGRRVSDREYNFAVWAYLEEGQAS